MWEIKCRARYFFRSSSEQMAEGREEKITAKDNLHIQNTTTTKKFKPPSLSFPSSFVLG